MRIFEGGWADQRNQRSIARQKLKTEAKLRELRQLQAQDLRDRIGPLPEPIDPDDVAHRVRGLVESESYRSPRLVKITEETHDLRSRLASMKAQMSNIEPAFRRAVYERARHLKVEEVRKDPRRLANVTSEGSRAWVYVLAVLLVLLEGVLLTSAAERVVRNLFPSFEDVTYLALVGVVVMVALGTVAVVKAAREFKRYVAQKAVAGAGMETDLDDEHLPEPTEPSPGAVIFTVALASFIQLFLFVLRIQVDSGDGSARDMFILVSLVATLLAGVIGFVEYRQYRADPELPISYDQSVIEQYLALDAQVRSQIPETLAHLEAERFRLLEQQAHDLQTVAGEVDGTVLRAVNQVVDDYRKGIDDARRSVTDYEPVDLDDVLETVMAEKRSARVRRSGTNGDTRWGKASVYLSTYDEVLARDVESALTALLEAFDIGLVPEGAPVRGSWRRRYRTIRRRNGSRHQQASELEEALRAIVLGGPMSKVQGGQAGVAKDLMDAMADVDECIVLIDGMLLAKALTPSGDTAAFVKVLSMAEVREFERDPDLATAPAAVLRMFGTAGPHDGHWDD